MSEIQIKLKESSVVVVPFQSYTKDFTFIVNGEEFQTSKIIANLISPKISQIQANDPTISEFIIQTNHQGNFQSILNLVNFQQNSIPSSEIPFISEVVQFLGNSEIEFHNPNESKEITQDNVFIRLKDHTKCPIYYSKLIEEEIEFASENFYKIGANQSIENLLNLPITTIEQILQSPKLQLESEDQLISIINQLYSNDQKYSILFDFVDFVFVSEEKISDFLNVFNIGDITNETWIRISNRLSKKISNFQSEKRIHQYRESPKEKPSNLIQIPYRQDFKGIINCLSFKGNILDEINIIASSFDEDFMPQNVVLFDDLKASFCSENIPNSWICIDFKERRVIPKSYTIRSCNWDENDCAHQRDWVIEGSNDNKEFIVLDEQRNCELLKGPKKVHTFIIDNPNDKKFRFIRMRTLKNWDNEYNFTAINAIEFYGTLLI